jgi:two-component system, sensor histidine kinase RegB
MTSPSGTASSVLMLDPPTGDVRADVRAQGLVRMRWGACIGQVVMILVAGPVFGVDLPVELLLAISGTLAASNAALTWALRRRWRASDTWCGVILAFDTLQLTALLFISGGTSNPFSVFYLVQIAIAAVTLGSRWTWFLAVLGVSSYAALFLMPPSAAADSAHGAHIFAQHLQAMWIALTLSVALVAYFVTRLTTALAQRDREIAAMRDIATRHERLAALTTLAAGAAHELGTPLTTVAVAAGELERAMATLAPEQAAAFSADVHLIRSEVRRCRAILDGMAAESGGAAGEMPTAFTAGDLVRDVLAKFAGEDRTRIEVADRVGSTALCLPRHALVRAVLSLARNALDAAPAPAVVAVTLDAASRLRICVRDTGVGMAEDVVSRAGEPFFTTKPPGRGMGLGLFLVRSLADHLGGRFTIDSTPGHGTTAVLELPTRIGADADRA